MIRFLRRWHRVLACIVGIQVILWVLGGVVMSVLPIDQVRGQHLRHAVIDTPDIPAIPAWLSDSDARWQSIAWHHRPDGWVLAVRRPGQPWQYRHVDNGQPVTVISSEQVSQRALGWYSGSGKVTNVSLIEQLPKEVSHLPAPVYRVEFDDWLNSTFYLDPNSAALLSVRSDMWRVYDFFWMLHIMDYDLRKDFNHPLLIGAALFALAFSLSGLMLVIKLLRQYSWRKVFA